MIERLKVVAEKFGEAWAACMVSLISCLVSSPDALANVPVVFFAAISRAFRRCCSPFCAYSSMSVGVVETALSIVLLDLTNGIFIDKI